MSGRLCAGKLRELAIQTFPKRRRIRDEKACKIYRIESEVGNRFLPALLGLRASQRAQQSEARLQATGTFHTIAIRNNALMSGSCEAVPAGLDYEIKMNLTL